MNIGSAKLQPEYLKRYPHALIDIRDPEQSYSVAEFCADATKAIEKAHVEQKIPVLVGGTIMYFRALMQGLAGLPGADPALRAKLEKRAELEGWPALHEQLRSVDAHSAARIAANDGQRIQRALEVFFITGKPLSKQLGNPSRFDIKWRFLQLVITPCDRHVLHQRIKQRVTSMLSEGFIEEVERLRDRSNLSEKSSSMRSVGYRQVWMMLEGKLKRSQLESEIVAATRQLAKRQLTWLRQMPGTIWINGLPTSADEGLDESIEQAFIVNRVKNFASN